MINQFTKFYNADDIEPIEFYGNCYNGNADLYTTMSYLPHVDTFPGGDEGINPLNDYAFNLNVTKSDKVKTASILLMVKNQYVIGLLTIMMTMIESEIDTKR